MSGRVQVAAAFLICLGDNTCSDSVDHVRAYVTNTLGKTGNTQRGTARWREYGLDDDLRIHLADDFFGADLSSLTKPEIIALVQKFYANSDTVVLNERGAKR